MSKKPVSDYKRAQSVALYDAGYTISDAIFIDRN